MQYTVKTPVFEGPFDLLLTLIEKRKLHVNDISLASVTDDYIQHVHERQGIEIGETAHFVLVASTLLLIKSRSLLPMLTLSGDEEGDVLELERRLKLYELFRGYGAKIKAVFGKAVLFARSVDRKMPEPVFSPSNDITLANLRASIGSVLTNLPKKEVLPEKAVEKVVSLEEMIERLSERITNTMNMSFKDFAGMGKSEKVHIIVSFLAMLELVKQGALTVMQDEHFSDIRMESQTVGAPSYK
jgi:segregation and condensation protein A